MFACRNTVVLELLYVGKIVNKVLDAFRVLRHSLCQGEHLLTQNLGGGIPFFLFSGWGGCEGALLSHNSTAGNTHSRAYDARGQRPSFAVAAGRTIPYLRDTFGTEGTSSCRE